MTSAIHPSLIPSSVISGVYTVPLKPYEDERGRFIETFRREWFPWVNWERLQSNRSDSKPQVLRGLHYHFHQVDYWYVPSGRIRVGLADLRPQSPNYGATQILELSDEQPHGLFIPEGVAHGFIALSACTLIYVVNNYYDGGRDEYGVAWDDPQLSLAWGVDAPLLSARDAQNPRLSDIPAERLPR